MMKKFVALLTVAAIAAIGSTAFAGMNPATGVNGSWHDITYLGQATGGTGYKQDDYQRVCIFCHTPHNAQPNGSVPAPLWNRVDTTPDMAPYTWAAPANLPINFDADPLIGPSRLCMGCHDGVTAVDKHGPTTGTAAGTPNYKALPGTIMTSPGRAITDLTVTHPIGFLYQDALDARTTAELVDPSQRFIERVMDGDGAAVPNTNRRTEGVDLVYQTKRISDTLYAGYLTCASCHEVHNTRNAVNDASFYTPGHIPNYFVWAREKNSALCLSCHVK